ncbi:MAG: hypothetical protein LBM41_01845 [Ruminococcus sp.]|jgi:hypothetical protein|nr:hypothetical protein [Ruminococcus sp.]
MKKLLAAILSAAMMIALFTGCKTDGVNTETTTGTTTEPVLGTVLPVAEGDAYAVDKLEFGYMPEGWEILGKNENMMVILSKENQVDIQGINYNHTLKDIDTFADSCMAVYKINNMLYQSDVLIDEPYHITVGTAKYDAVVYDFTIVVNEFLQDEAGEYLTDENGEQIKEEKMRYGGKAVFFYSGVDAYYMIFQCNEENYERIIPEFEKLLAGITVNENIKASDTSALTFTTPAAAE